MTEQNVTIELSLPLAAVNYIMAVLAKQPFEQVADLVMDTGRQSAQSLAKDLLARLNAECSLSA